MSDQPQARLNLFGDESETRELSDAAEILTANGTSLTEVVDLSDTADLSRAAPVSEAREFVKDSLFDGDPKFPLESFKHEAFLTSVANGLKANVAWIDKVSNRCTLKSAAEQASRYLKRPAVKARLRCLIQERKAVQNREDADEFLGKDDLARELQKIGMGHGSPSERRQALMDLAKLRGLIKGEEDQVVDPDPVFVVEYFKKAREQGVDVAAQARSQVGEGDRAGAPPGDAGGDSEGFPGPGTVVEAQDVVVGQ